jgi:hypothetical protein
MLSYVERDLFGTKSSRIRLIHSLKEDLLKGQVQPLKKLHSAGRL